MTGCGRREWLDRVREDAARGDESLEDSMSHDCTVAGASSASTRTLARLAGIALRGIRGLARALAHRQDVKRLAEMDDRALKDIGLLRSDVVGALAEPFHKDPSTVLLVRRVERRARARLAGVGAGAVVAERGTAKEDCESC